MYIKYSKLITVTGCGASTVVERVVINSHDGKMETVRNGWKIGKEKGGLKDFQNRTMREK
jgi:hypothetical protein